MKRVSKLRLTLTLFLTAYSVAEAVKVEIIHWNDVSGQIESFQRGTLNSSAAPTPCQSGKLEECVGGVVNLVHHIWEPSVVEVDASLRLSSGNMIGGESGWIASIGWEKYGKYIKDHFRPNITALGMKEFGAGVDKTCVYMDAIGNITVLANTCAETYREKPESDFCTNIFKLKIVQMGTMQVGVIGFITPLAEQLSLAGKLKFEDVAKAIGDVVSEHSTIKIFIAIGDGNLKIAKEIIEKVPKVKLVLYGSAYVNCTKDRSEDFPLAHKDGIIACSGRYGSTIGRLVLDISPTGDITFDPNSKIIETVRPEKLNEAAIKAENDYIQKLLPDVEREKNDTIGHARIRLEGGLKCWRQECNLGNIVADSMVHCAMVRAPIAKPYPFPIHSIWHGGALFENTVNPAANITKFDIHKWLPYHNRAHLVSTNGTNLRNIFEESAGGIDPQKSNKKDWRQFLQVSNGMEVYYSSDSGVPKLVNIRMTQDKDGMPQMTDIVDNQDYYVVIPTILYEGRSVYGFARSYWKDVTHENIPSDFSDDDDCVENYIRAVRQVSTGLEERIWIDGGIDSSLCECKESSTALTVFLTILIFVMLSAVIFIGHRYIYARMRQSHIEYPPNQL